MCVLEHRFSYDKGGEVWRVGRKMQAKKGLKTLLAAPVFMDTSHPSASALIWLQLTSPVKPAAFSNVLPNTSIGHTPQSHPGETL